MVFSRHSHDKWTLDCLKNLIKLPNMTMPQKWLQFFIADYERQIIIVWVDILPFNI